MCKVIAIANQKGGVLSLIHISPFLQKSVTDLFSYGTSLIWYDIDTAFGAVSYTHLDVYKRQEPE